ncbi:hypothetical protein Tco_1446617 [Tanacetum coccineum]
MRGDFSNWKEICARGEICCGRVYELHNTDKRASGNQGHYRSDCPKLKNQNHRNQTGSTGARGMVHALGGGEINQDLNNMEDDINA